MDVLCVMSTPMLWKYSWCQETISLGRNQAFHRLGRTVLDGSSWIPQSCTVAVPCSCYRWCTLAAGSCQAESCDAIIHSPCSHVGINRGKAEDTYQNNTCQNAERRRAEKQTFKEDAGTWDAQTRESGKKTGSGGTNRLEAVAGQGQKNRKDLQAGD